MDFKDKVGTVLKPGDFIIYGHSICQSCGIQYGMVLEVFTSSAYDGLTVLRIIGVDDGSYQDRIHHEPTLLSRPSVIKYSERTLKVTKKQVPKAILTLLNAYAE